MTLRYVTSRGNSHLAGKTYTACGFKITKEWAACEPGTPSCFNCFKLYRRLTK